MVSTSLCNRPILVQATTHHAHSAVLPLATPAPLLVLTPQSHPLVYALPTVLCHLLPVHAACITTCIVFAYLPCPPRCISLA